MGVHLMNIQSCIEQKATKNKKGAVNTTKREQEIATKRFTKVFPV